MLSESGLASEIYSELKAELEPDLTGANVEPSDISVIEAQWQKIANAVARAVVNHIVSNLEIMGIQTTVSTNVTGTAGPYPVVGTGTGTGTQSNPGTGLVR